MFDIHKVKPVHGWREFIGEVGIIVLGVLIALAFEQAVETLHWRHKVSEATDALQGAVAVSSLPAIEQEMVSNCVDQQLTSLEDRLLSDGPYKPAPVYEDRSNLPAVIRAPQRPWGNGVWRIVTQEGVGTHLNAEMRDQLDGIYSEYDSLNGLSHDNSQDLWALNSLSRPAFSTRPQREQMVQTIERIRGRNYLMTLSSAQLLGRVHALGMLPKRSYVIDHVTLASGTIAYCSAHGLRIDAIHFRSVV